MGDAKRHREHTQVDVNNLNQTLDMLSGIMKRVDKVRETLRNFNTMLQQVRQIIHNKMTTLQSLENDVSQWWLHIEQNDSMKFAAIQKLKSMNDERGLLNAASELTSIVNSSSNIEKSLRRWGRMVKMENYSRETLRAKVIEWTKRWASKWVDLNETYKQLRAELLSSSKNYIKIYETRTQGEAILDNAHTALAAANQLTQKQSVMDTPPPMMRGQMAQPHRGAEQLFAMANEQYNSVPEVVKPGQGQGQGQQTQQAQMMQAQMMQAMQQQQSMQAPPQKKKKRRRTKSKSASGGGGGQPQMDMSNVPPELMAQLMQYQNGGGASGPPQKSVPPPAPVKPGQYTMKPLANTISYSADQWS